MTVHISLSKVIGLFLGVVFVALAVFSVVKDWKLKSKLPPEPVRPVKSTVIKLPYEGAKFKFPGKVAANVTVQLAFQVDGPLIEFPVLKGQRVKKGELLGRIDPRDYKNNLLVAKAMLDKANVHLSRIEKAIKTGAVSETDLTNAKAEADSAQANYDIHKKALEDTYLHAPFDGVISNTYVENFENVKAKQVVLTIDDISSILVEADFPERIVAMSRKGVREVMFKALFDFIPDQTFDLKVREYETSADPITQTYRVTFEMATPEKYNILPGMTANVSVERTDEHDDEGIKFLVPVDAVAVDDMGSYYVWKLVEKDGQYIARENHVWVGMFTEDSIEVNSGLKRGDRIATAGVHFLQEGEVVTLLEDRKKKE